VLALHRGGSAGALSWITGVSKKAETVAIPTWRPGPSARDLAAVDLESGRATASAAVPDLEAWNGVGWLPCICKTPEEGPDGCCAILGFLGKR
jgi:hypothetical protein